MLRCMVMLELFWLMLLAGCATPASRVGERPMSADEGIVRVSLAANTGQVASWSSIEVTQVDDSGAAVSSGRKFALVRVGGPYTRGAVMGAVRLSGILPEGGYKVSRLVDDRTSQFVDLKGGADRLGTFRVRAGQTSDLGTLLVVIQFKAVAIARIDEATTGNPAQVAAAGTASGAWDRPDPKSADILAYALQHAAGIFDVCELQNGQVVAASRMGTVLVRESARTWKRKRVAGIEDVYAIATYPGAVDAAKFVVGGESNLLAIVGNNEVRRINAPLPAGSIVSLHHNPAGSAWVLLLQDEELMLRAYSAPGLESGVWKELYSVKLESPYPKVQRPRLSVVKHPGSITIGIEDLKQDVVVNINFETGAVRPIAVDRIAGVLAPTAGGILSAGVRGWNFKQIYSFDEGLNWMSLPENMTSYLPTVFPSKSVEIFRDAQSAVNYVSGDAPVGKIKISLDGGATWTESSRVPQGKWYVVPGGTIFVSPSDAMLTSISESSNNGLSWTEAIVP
ncbi:hypothetical protein [Solimonas sp. K1W22B-7]|uniref:hypothetical protein n=1 Tax=Solimonas sp. K1W22B-7 TaxID=2303331 RepID=UPI0013C4D3A8|nr:hypothetical protein [Solimonas sp. K1W22B-7]